jgi:hypothetical protein
LSDTDPSNPEPPMRQLVLDHVAIGCETLEQGAAYLRERLGVDIGPGGKHAGRGTHNRLMRMGERVYLELIAIDPDAPTPQRPRGFALDDVEQQQRIHERPRPVGWLASTRDLALDIAMSPVHLGHVTEMTRGKLTWKISERDEGTLLERGLVPSLIQWPDGVHPSASMADPGVRFERLRLLHPDPDHLTTLLEGIGVLHLVEVAASDDGEPRIELDVRTPRGELVTLG